MKAQEIDEVTALRDIFITFFDTSNRSKAHSDKEKLLVSMEMSESSLNPFYDHTRDDELFEQNNRHGDTGLYQS